MTCSVCLTGTTGVAGPVQTSSVLGLRFFARTGHFQHRGQFLTGNPRHLKKIRDARLVAGVRHHWSDASPELAYYRFDQTVGQFVDQLQARLSRSHRRKNAASDFSMVGTTTDRSR